ncbi:MAG: Wzz/FepE/Etk N-terminal domain-containing protein [Anaerolineae bacterium]|jgi:capsular exopolysaccharide synthesis family protein|nr:Wzz/FepE/Etk N-terminal domain-containing protein [Anaerolineae bacterium]
MELQFYLNVLKRRLPVIAIVMAAALSVVAIAGFLITPVYTAKATLRIMLDVGMADFQLREDYNIRLLNTYASILRSGPVLTKAIDRLAPRSAGLSSGELYEATSVEVIPNTELISIGVQSSDPTLARDLANELGLLLIEYSRDIYMGSGKSTLEIVNEQLRGLEEELQQDQQKLEALLAEGTVGTEVDALRSQIQFKENSYNDLLERYETARLSDALRANSITISTPATLPNTPSNRVGLTQVGLSIVIGLFAGIGLALALENLDTSIRSPYQLEHLTNLPVLGTVPGGLLPLDKEEEEEGKTGHNLQPLEEAYRLLGVNLPALKGIVAVQTILITSAVPHEGKTTVAANLAHILSERGRPIYLVESDLRHPNLFRRLGWHEVEEETRGLGDLLMERPELTQEMLDGIVRSTPQPDLFIIGGGGPRVANPTALLGSSFMEELLGYFGTQGSMILLDAPPVLGMADVSVLAPKVEGVILVVAEAHSKREDVLAAIKQLQASHATVFGFVFVEKGEKSWRYA